MNPIEYDPVPFDPAAFAQEKRQQSASFDAALTALDDEFAALAVRVDLSDSLFPRKYSA